MNTGVNRLCFGTSTFVAGRLRPNKESEPGIGALRAAVLDGVRLIHSNPKLGTQWAVRRALDFADSPSKVRHLVKAEAPADADSATVRSHMRRAIADSCDNLGIDQVHAVTVEIDLKRTQDRAALVNQRAVRTFYASAAEAVLQTGHAGAVLAYCHSPAHMTAVLLDGCVQGVAAQYNLAEPWPALFLERIAERDMCFVGMSPLRRGALVGVGLPGRLAGEPAAAALHWAFADPRVSAVVTTMSSRSHLNQAIEAAQHPCPAACAQDLAAAWLDAVHQHPSPEGNGWSPVDRLLSCDLLSPGGPS